MSTFLFDSIIFGPVWSRRLGESLGINLLPAGKKVCNFNCIYCECGITPASAEQARFPSVEEVKNQLIQKLSEMKQNSAYLDTITFAGNGEPTLHPCFDKIVEEVLVIRDQYFPEVSVAVLSNATLIGSDKIFNSLLKVDLNILKLDSAIESTLQQINCPNGKYNPEQIIAALKRFKGKVIIQTLFLKGMCNGKYVDNSTEEEVNAWTKVIEEIAPDNVMIYSLARDTAVNHLEQVSASRLNEISDALNSKGIKTLVTP